jgi:hypothetical protein
VAEVFRIGEQHKQIGGGVIVFELLSEYRTNIDAPPFGTGTQTPNFLNIGVRGARTDTQ